MDQVLCVHFTDYFVPALRAYFVNLFRFQFLGFPDSLDFAQALLKHCLVKTGCRPSFPIDTLKLVDEQLNEIFHADFVLYNKEDMSAAKV